MTYERSTKELKEHDKIEREAFANFSGPYTDFERALGVFRIAAHLGWKPVVLGHNKRTLKKYEDILGIKFKDYFPEAGPSAMRNRGYKIALELGNFWKAVSGDKKIENKKDIT